MLVYVSIYITVSMYHCVTVCVCVQISVDFLLRSYSVILLDEAHERNLNTDVLLGMLSR